MLNSPKFLWAYELEAVKGSRTRQIKWLSGSPIPSQSSEDILTERKVKVKVWVAQLCFNSATPWPVVYPAPQSVGFSRGEHWNALPFPSPGVFPNPEIKPGSPTLQADSLPSESPGKPIHTEVKP